MGIAGSARQTALQDPDAVEGYFPAGADDWPALTLLVKAANRAEDLSVSIAGVARSIDPALIPEIRLLKASFRDKVQQTELTALAVGLLGISALALACVGIVGLVAYSVAQRTKEIGIRMALGASARDVQGGIIRQTLKLATIGMALGTIASWIMAQSAAGLLFGITARDPGTFLAMLLVLTLVALVAGYLPARRASRIDPMVALRAE